MIKVLSGCHLILWITWYPHSADKDTRLSSFRSPGWGQCVPAGTQPGGSVSSRDLGNSVSQQGAGQGQFVQQGLGGAVCPAGTWPGAACSSRDLGDSVSQQGPGQGQHVPAGLGGQCVPVGTWPGGSVSSAQETWGHSSWLPVCLLLTPLLGALTHLLCSLSSTGCWSVKRNIFRAKKCLLKTTLIASHPTCNVLLSPQLVIPV